MDAEWPDGRERTPADEREPYPHGFEVTRNEAFKSILDQLRKMDARNVQVKSDVHHQQRNSNLPYSDAHYDDPGVVVYYELEGQQYAMPMDRWDTPRDNARAIALTLKAKRAFTRYGVETMESEFQRQALPSGEEADDVIAAEPPAHQVLGVDPDPVPEEVQSAFRELVQEAHPDQGGSDEQFQRVKRAREELIG
jgi:hypothetical protein